MPPARTRVAYVIGELGKGGAEYQLVELLRHLDRRTWEPHLTVLSEGGYWVDEVRRLDVPVVELPRRGGYDLTRVGRLRRTLYELAPGVLHTVLWSANCYGRLAALGLRIPRVVTAERNVIARPRWEIAIERLLDPLTDVYLVNAAAVARELERHGLPARKMRVVHNGVDLSRFPPFSLERAAARAAAGFAPERRLVAQVGRLAPQKDYPTYLRAAATVAARHRDVDFLVIGDGPERGDLGRLAGELGIAARVRWLGLRHDVPALLAGVDVLVLASRYEGLPNVVIEAMASGAAVVATDVGGCRELVEPGTHGVLVEPGRPETIAEAVSALLADEGRRTAMARAARRRIEEQFSIDAMVRNTCALYTAETAP
ncbi:MAG TPA: glycosyltransferase [Candidatus Limnocylindria bacterium]|nr:glycosyltransferase [Candidatus Limnocylindria bacterium]